MNHIAVIQCDTVPPTPRKVLPMSTHVVMEAQQGSRKFLAWSLFDGGPGYTEVTYTGLDGNPDVEVDLNEVRITRHLFNVTGPEAPAPQPRLVFTDEYLVAEADATIEAAFDRLKKRVPVISSEAEIHIDIRQPRGLLRRRTRRVFVSLSVPA